MRRDRQMFLPRQLLRSATREVRGEDASDLAKKEEEEERRTEKRKTSFALHARCVSSHSLAFYIRGAV